MLTMSRVSQAHFDYSIGNFCLVVGAKTWMMTWVRAEYSGLKQAITGTKAPTRASGRERCSVIEMR